MMSLLGIARRLLKLRSCLLLLTLLGACALPVNTALRDWSRVAESAVTRPDAAEPARAIQQALSLYFHALGVLWDGAELSFDEPRFQALTRQVPDPAPAAAMLELGRALRAASDEKPPRWLPRDNSGPAPAYEDRRLPDFIRDADAPVRRMLVALSAMTAPGEPPAAAATEGTSDPALRQARIEQEADLARQADRRRASAAGYIAALDQVAEAQAMLGARPGDIMQRSIELRLRLAEDRLRRLQNDRLLSAAGS